jgi:putative heme transporter
MGDPNEPSSAKTGTEPSETPASAKPAAKTSKRKAIIGAIVTIVVLVVVFLGIFPQFASYQDAWTAIQGMTAPWLVALLIACAVNIFVYVWPFQAAIPGLRYWPGFSVRQTSYAISNGIPAVGGAIGLGVQYKMLESFGVGGAASAAGIAINTVWNLILTLALPIVSVILLVFTGQATKKAATLAAIGVGVIAVGGVLLALILRSDEEARRIGDFVERVLNWMLKLVHHPMELHVGDSLVKFRESTVDVIRGRWVLLTFTNLLMQLASFMVLFVALRGIQVGEPTHATFAEAFAAFAFGRLASFIPLTPGGLGTVDAAITGILSLFGASNSDALAADLVWRALTYIPQELIGLVTFLLWRARQARRTMAAEAGAAA